MKQFFTILAESKRASSAAEFALVLPLLLIFLVGLVDVGRLMWTWNRAEMATQMGVRYAVATEMVPTALVNYSFALSGGIPQGGTIPSSSFGGIACTSNGTSASCTCTKSPCGPSTLISDQTKANAAFTNIVQRMQNFMPEIAASNVQVGYDNSGLGYAGDPNGPDVSPLVTVSIRPDTLSFRPILFSLFKTATIPLPSFSASLTMEDGQGSVSN